MGRIYYAEIQEKGITAVADIFWVGSPTDAVTVIHELSITQDASETSLQVPLSCQSSVQRWSLGSR